MRKYAILQDALQAEKAGVSRLRQEICGDAISALRNVQCVMKNGMLFKRDGVMVPESFFHPGPVKGWRAM